MLKRIKYTKSLSCIRHHECISASHEPYLVYFSLLLSEKTNNIFNFLRLPKKRSTHRNRKARKKKPPSGDYSGKTRINNTTQPVLFEEVRRHETHITAKNGDIKKMCEKTKLRKAGKSDRKKRPEKPTWQTKNAPYNGINSKGTSYQW